jgi:hypothetical protein
MQNIMVGQVIGYGSGDVSGAQAYVPGLTLLSGIRLRTANGKVHWIKNCIVGPEGMLVLQGAVRSGDTTELWMTGKPEKPYVYGIRTGTESSYENVVASAARKPAHFFLFMGLLTLILGIGLLFLIAAIGIYWSAAQYEAPYSETQFDAGINKANPAMNSIEGATSVTAVA